MMPFRGVRSSCETLARKRLFASVAERAASSAWASCSFLLRSSMAYCATLRAATAARLRSVTSSSERHTPVTSLPRCGSGSRGPRPAACCRPPARNRTPGDRPPRRWRGAPAWPPGNPPADRARRNPRRAGPASRSGAHFEQVADRLVKAADDALRVGLFVGMGARSNRSR